MKIGDKVWIFDNNNRVYKDDDGNETRGAWYRGYFCERYIVGETSRSWIVGFEWSDPDHPYNVKVNKKNLTYSTTDRYGMDGKLYVSEEEIDRLCWINKHQHFISEEVGRCNDYDKLKKIAEILEMK